MDMLGPYKLGPADTENWGVYIGDARKLMQDISEGSIDVIGTDPPYFLPAQHYSTRKKWARSVADLSVIESFFDDMLGEFRRILKQNGILIICCDGQSYPILYVKMYRLFDRLIDIVWDKGQIGLGNGIRRQHEWLLIGLPSRSQFPGWESSIISCKPVPSNDRIHPAEKPIELWMKLLSALIHPNAIFVDPFCGSGSGLVAAYLCGLRFFGFDLEQDYITRARRRIAQTQPPLLGLKVEQPRLGLDETGHEP